jgi:hypothetical protein
MDSTTLTQFPDTSIPRRQFSPSERDRLLEAAARSLPAVMREPFAPAFWQKEAQRQSFRDVKLRLFKAFLKKFLRAAGSIKAGHTQPLGPQAHSRHR